MIIEAKKRRVRKSPITNELKRKHALGITLSPLDLCLRRGIISDALHRAANRFIFLHNARFGLASMKCHTSWHYNINASYTILRNEEQVSMIRKEYLAISRILQNLRSYNLVVNVCIHDYYPHFLRSIGNLKKDFYEECMSFKNALLEMDKFMCAHANLRNKH